MTLHLACAARRDYVPHTAAMLHSALSQGGEAEVQVHFLHGPDLPARYARKLSEMVEAEGGRISFLAVGRERVAGLRTLDYLPASHWYRVFLPELLPDVDRVLYLDADLIVLESIRPLWETDMHGHCLAAVTNVFQADHLHIPAQLGLPANRYFNTGVLVMNLERMRERDSTQAVLEYARANHERLAWPEQDALNVVLGEERLPLHPRWNCMNSILEFPWAAEVLGAEAVEEARRRPAIRHFEGPTANKPWHYMCERSMRELYLEHRRHTPWPRVRMKGATPRNVWRRWRAPRRHAVSA